MIVATQAKAETTLDRQEFHSELDDIWKLRNGDRVLCALRKFHDKCYALGVRLADSPKQQFQQLLSKGLSAQDSLDFILLQVSFERNRLNQNAAWTLLSDIGSIYDSSSIPFDYYYYNQRALNYSAESNHTMALENFTIAYSLVDNQRDRWICCYNQLLCLEYLGYDYRPLLATLTREVDLTDPANANFSDHLIQLRLREAWRIGKIKHINQLIMANLENIGAKTASFVDWLMHLPMVKLDLPTHAILRIHELVAQSQESYMIPYRMRTTQGLLIREDLTTSVPPRFKIERFYCWVWMWLLDPTPVKLNRVLQLRHDLMKSMSGQLAPDHYKLYHLGMRWLAIFSDIDDETIESNLSDLVFALDGEVPILNLESLVIDYARALIDSDLGLITDTKTYLENREVYTESGIQVDTFLASIETNASVKINGTFGELAHAIHSLRSAKLFPYDEAPDGVVVDLTSRTVNVIQNGETCGSSENEGILHLLTLTSGRKSVTCSELINRCFGQRSYDPTIHDAKIGSLLNKTNNLTEPFISFWRKNGCVHMKGSCEKILLLGFSRHLESITLNHTAIDSLLQSPTPRAGASVIDTHSPAPKGNHNSPEPSPLQSGNGNWLTRQDFEKELGVSRATALRKLQHWLDEKLVTRKGKGRSSRYQISTKLIMQMRKNGGNLCSVRQ